MEKKRSGAKVFLVIMLLFFVGCIAMAVMMANGVIAVPESGQAEEQEQEQEVFYKSSVEEYITTYLGLSNPSFSMKDYRDWEDGAGFVMVENTYKVNGVEHKYLARVGKDNMIYKLTIDGEVMFSADADTLLEYMEKYTE